MPRSRINKKELLISARSAGIGALSGIGIASVLRLPVIGMFIDCNSPERGLMVVYGLSGLMGGIIGIITNYAINQQKEDSDS